MQGAKFGGEAHDTQGAKARGLDWNGGSDADRNDRTDALSFYSFHERRWQFEMLRRWWNSKGLLNLPVCHAANRFQCGLFSVNERAHAVNHYARK
jgi:hypothetical protein